MIDLMICWIFTGCVAFLLVIMNLIRAATGKNAGWRMFLFASLFCGVLAVLCSFQMICGWARAEAIDSLLDVVPTLAAASSGALCLGCVLNLLAIWMNLRIEGKTDEKS